MTSFRRPAELWVFAVGGKRDVAHVFSFEDEAEARRVFAVVSRPGSGWKSTTWWGRYVAAPVRKGDKP